MDAGTRFVQLIFTLIHLVLGANMASSSDDNDDDNNLKQALFLVRLLKLDHLDHLREIEANITAEANNTCPDTPGDSSYSSTPMNNDVTTVSVSMTTAPSATLLTLPASVLPSAAIPASALLSVPLPPSPLPSAAWPATALPPAAFPAQAGPALMPTAVASGTPAKVARLPLRRAAPLQDVPFLDKNNYPYSFQRRRMIPDYYYYDFPMRKFGSFRRLDQREQINQLRHAVNPAGTEAVSSTPAEAISGSSSDHPASPASKTSSPATPAMSSLPSTAASTTTTTATTSSTALHKKKFRKKAIKHKGSNNGIPKLGTKIYDKDRPACMSDVLDSGKTKEEAVATKPPTEEAIVSSQVASELMKEIEGSRPKKIKERFTSRTPRSTFKLYLPGSSRLPIPFPENNAFCHLYPQSALCGSVFK